MNQNCARLFGHLDASFGANKLCVAVLEELHRNGSEAQRFVRYLQAQRS